MGNNNKKEINKLDLETFRRVKSKFREYWKVLFKLIATYIIVYLAWFSASDYVTHYLDKKGEKGWTLRSLSLAIVLILIQGALFTLDGLVTSLLKSPFNQMCYTINKAEGIKDKTKDYIITKATESNEHCKETLKKFGILAISSELIRVFIQVKPIADTDKYGDYAALFNISYLIPVTFAGLAILSINYELKKIEKMLIVSRGKKS